MRIISMFGALLITSQVFATTIKIKQIKPLASSTNSQNTRYSNQKFKFITASFGVIEANVCSTLGDVYTVYRRGNADTLQFASDRNLFVDAEITFEGMDPAKDACVSSAKIVAN